MRMFKFGIKCHIEFHHAEEAEKRKKRFKRREKLDLADIICNGDEDDSGKEVNLVKLRS